MREKKTLKSNNTLFMFQAQTVAAAGSKKFHIFYFSSFQRSVGPYYSRIYIFSRFSGVPNIFENGI